MKSVRCWEIDVMLSKIRWPITIGNLKAVVYSAGCAVVEFTHCSDTLASAIEHAISQIEEHGYEIYRVTVRDQPRYEPTDDEYADQETVRLCNDMFLLRGDTR